MHLLDYNAAAGWCSDHGIHAREYADGLSIIPAVRQLPNLEIGVEERPAKRILLARTLLGLGSPESESLDFPGALFWLGRWNIGTEAVEQVGMHVALALLAGAHAPTAPTRLDQAQLFDRSETVATQAAMALALLMEWDAYLIPESALYAVYISHDGYVQVASADEPILERARRRCEG